MAQQELNSFTDWIFNRFVEAEEKSRLSGFPMQNTLQYFTDTVLKSRKYSPQRSHANYLLKEMKAYFKDFRNHKLEYVGEESLEKKRQAEADRQALYLKLGIHFEPRKY